MYKKCDIMEKPIHGRGASGNPANRFLETNLEYDVDEETGQIPRPDTQILRDHTTNIISTNKSPDIGFDVSLNPYRGCEHGCVYCYARPTHEFLGMSAGLDFESKIVAKFDAPKLLREKLADQKWKPKTLVMSGVTDPYQPIEKKLRITRGCIEVLAEARHPLAIITKNYLVTRDIDKLSELAEVGAVSVTVSITSLDRTITATMEPRTSRPQKRLQAVRELTEAGIPVNVNIAPVIPGLTDVEIIPIMEAAAEAGAVSAGCIVVRLPYSVKDIFVKWLEDHYPDRKQKVINRIKSLKKGRLNRPEFGDRFSIEGAYADQIRQMVAIHSKKLRFRRDYVPLNTSAFRRPSTDQLNLF